MRPPTLRVTESGESTITIDLLLDTIVDAMRQGVYLGQASTGACGHLQGAMETLTKMGYLEVLTPKKEPRGSAPVSTTPKEPPSWLSDAFKDDKVKGEGGDDGTPGV